jgi:NDP-sugar pyrophosphorylase family protein
MPNFLESLRLDGEKVIAYGLHEQWLDVGRPTEFAEAQDLLKKKPISADKVRNIYD